MHADKASRAGYKIEGEWKGVFAQINDTFGPFDLDLIVATRLNTQCTVNLSWYHDPGSVGTDAFMQDWCF